MIELFDELLKVVDGRRLLEKAGRLYQIEQGQCQRAYGQSARFVEELMRESALERVERIAFPADGKTCYLDKTMPLAWDATVGKLTLVSSRIPFAEPLIADYQRHPFHLIKGSVATPPGGVVTTLITEEQLFGGCETANAMVIADPETRPGPELYAAACRLGALGIVCDWIRSRYETPDAISWVNAFTEGPHWHVIASDRPMIGFSVSSRVGDALRAAARAGQVVVRVECDGKRYEGEYDVVTGVLPGSDEREVWTLAHLYEPLSDDNTPGAVGGIEIAKALEALIDQGKVPRPRFTLRVVCALELYGFASYAAHRGGRLREQVIGGANLDGFPVLKDVNSYTVYAAPPGTPFFGNYLLEQAYEKYRGKSSPTLGNFVESGLYADDTFLSDPTTGLPTVNIRGGGKLWHTSAQDMSIVDRKNFERSTAWYGAFLAGLLFLEPAGVAGEVFAAGAIARSHLQAEVRRILDEAGKEPAASERELLARARRRLEFRVAHEAKQLGDFKRAGDCPAIHEQVAMLRREGEEAWKSLEKILRELWTARPSLAEGAKENPWLEYAATIRPSRAAVGLPYDLQRVPKSDRRKLPESCIYGPLARIMANIDGKKTLKDVMLEVEWETGVRFAGGAKKYINAVAYLGDWGYLDVQYDAEIRREEIVRTLRQAGLKAGDLAMVHSGLSPFGHIRGGGDAVIDAFLEVLGKEGTLLMPTFTRAAIHFDGNGYRDRRYRPFETGLPESIWVGRIPQVMLKRRGVMQSVHCTHSVAGIGPLSQACLGEHREDDPPTCRRSPFGKLLDHNGKMVWFGAGLGPTTFFHFLETELDLPYLGCAICRVKTDQGKARTVFVPKHLPGHRDFYRQAGEESKMYRRLMEMGLEIRSVALGMSTVKVIDALQMYELGMKALRAEPNLLLCDEETCPFCARHKV